jgi:tetratricopeptide (TPR) repeat protein
MDLKAEGNAFFAKKMYEQAIEKYGAALALHPQNHAMVATLLTNRAAAFINLTEYSMALQDCEQALAIDPSRDKALFRKGQAHEGLGEMGKAFQDFKKVLHRDPGNRAVIAAMRRCKEQLEQSSGDQAPAVLAVNRLRELRTDAVAERISALNALISYTHDDASASMAAFRAGAWGLIWGLRNSDSTEEVSVILPRREGGVRAGDILIFFTTCFASLSCQGWTCNSGSRCHEFPRTDSE